MPTGFGLSLDLARHLVTASQEMVPTHPSPFPGAVRARMGRAMTLERPMTSRPGRASPGPPVQATGPPGWWTLTPALVVCAVGCPVEGPAGSEAATGLAVAGLSRRRLRSLEDRDDCPCQRGPMRRAHGTAGDPEHAWRYGAGPARSGSRGAGLRATGVRSGTGPRRSDQVPPLRLCRPSGSGRRRGLEDGHAGHDGAGSGKALEQARQRFFTLIAPQYVHPGTLTRPYARELAPFGFGHQVCPRHRGRMEGGTDDYASVWLGTKRPWGLRPCPRRLGLSGSVAKCRPRAGFSGRYRTPRGIGGSDGTGPCDGVLWRRGLAGGLVSRPRPPPGKWGRPHPRRTLVACGSGLPTVPRFGAPGDGRRARGDGCSPTDW